MALDYSLVKFKGKSGRSNYLVLTRDVKGFKPKSLEDITDKEYMVKWQDSFHDEDADLHHNGCYPATVLLVGATPEELRAKAKELKIKFPARIPLPQCPDDEVDVKPMKKPLTKRRSKTNDLDPKESAKKQRMMATAEAILDKSQTSSSKTPSGSRHTSRSGSGHRHHRSSQSMSFSSKKSEPPNQTPLERSHSLSKIDMGKDSSESGHHHCLSPSKSSDSPSKSALHSSQRSHPLKADLKEDLSESEHHHFSNKSESSHSSPKSASESSQKPQSLDNANNDLKSHFLSSIGKILSQKFDDNLTFKETPPIVVKTTPKKKEDNDSDTTEVVTSDEDDPTMLLDHLKKEHKLCTGKIETLQKKLKNMEAKTKKLEHEVANNNLSKLKLLKEIADLRAENFSLQMKLKKTGSVLGDSDSIQASEEDDYSKMTFKSATSPVSVIDETTSDSLFGNTSPWAPGKHTGLQQKKTVAKQLFMENGEQKVMKTPDVKKNGSPYSPAVRSFSEYSTTPEKQDRKKGLKVKFASNATDVKKVTTPDTKMKRDAFSQDEDEFGSGLGGVSKRIEADLRGLKPLQGDAKKVNVGMGLKISRSAWEKSLRLKSDDSKFLKDSAGLMWGREALQARTGNRSTSNKKPCTPKKVGLLHAMLTGKMLARDEEETQRKFILENMAPKWLTEKCYDSGRKPKAPKAKAP